MQNIIVSFVHISIRLIVVLNTLRSCCFSLVQWSMYLCRVLWWLVRHGGEHVDGGEYHEGEIPKQHHEVNGTNSTPLQIQQRSDQVMVQD